MNRAQTVDLDRNGSRHRPASGSTSTARAQRRPWKKSSSPASASPIEKSLEAKREATSVVEVITAEDIGKMPDKNVADSLARVPGVTISSASANEGGFDENDRVSMRGTNPSLTQTLLNGHNVAAGDWFVLNQVQQVGRSVSYTLLPSELVEPDRRAQELAGVAGRGRRRRLGRHHHAQAARLQRADDASARRVGAVYAELPDKTDPQFSALFNWKNEANNFGVMVQAFSETRHLRRDGVEMLGYETIAPGQRHRAVATRISPACSIPP